MRQTQDFGLWMLAQQKRIELVLQDVFSNLNRAAPTLHQAMRYAVLEGGKRIRPLLVYASAQTVNCPVVIADAIAASLELIHVYSLVHDDLPCMDNDIMRRGKPTVWKAYGEATAMLVGDALQSLAFEVLADALLHEKSNHAAATIVALSRAAGIKGMCGGQQMDLDSVGKHLTMQSLEQMHQHKTGALLKASVSLPAIAAGASVATIATLNEYAQAVGLAFQITDDILDATVDSTSLGKTAGKDQQVDKSTYPALMGLAPAKAYAQELHDQAFHALAYFGEHAAELNQISQFLLSRKS